jgi:hypothetical protein
VLKRLSVATQFLVLQLCIVLVVVVSVAGVSLAQSTASFREREGRRLLSVAETVAATDTVRLGLVDASAKSLATAASARVSGASSVVIADEFGVHRPGVNQDSTSAQYGRQRPRLDHDVQGQLWRTSRCGAAHRSASLAWRADTSPAGSYDHPANC